MDVLGRLLMELREQLKGDEADSLRFIEPLAIPAFLLFGETDPNKLHDLKAALDGYQVYAWDQVEDLVALYLGGADRGKLDPLLDTCFAVYRSVHVDDGDVDFKVKAEGFTRPYRVFASALPDGNADGEKQCIAHDFLTPKLPEPEEQGLSKGTAMSK